MILNRLKTSGKLSGISENKARQLQLKKEIEGSLSKDEKTWLNNYNKSKKK